LAVHIRVGLPRQFSELSPFSTRAFISEYAASMSLLGTAAFVAVPGLSFTWRMNLPVTCNKRPDPHWSTLQPAKNVVLAVNFFGLRAGEP
jgi:hypothetical protein